jgi:GC-rich sequence DNA-binding factor
MEIDGLPREADLGPDGDLAASMVTTAVIPRLCRILAGGGVDPYSAKHMKRAIDLVEQVELTVDHRDAKFQVCCLKHESRL